jgi:hypothetical protein
MSELEQALKALEVTRTECHNGGHHDGAPQRARSRAEEEEEGQGGRRTAPRTEEPPLRRADGSVAPQTPNAMRKTGRIGRAERTFFWP